MFASRAWQRALFFLLLAALRLCAAPTLTTIQDKIYRTDGTPFEGRVVIQWNTLPGTGQGSVLNGQTVTIQVVNGALRVQLTPTTTAGTVAWYSVRYLPQNGTVSQERWTVPPSTRPLTLNEVRGGTGSGPVVTPPTDTVISIRDVTGLTQELQSRPSRGTGYTPSRVAVINASGALDGASGNPSDCVRVDGTSGPCQTGAGSGSGTGTVASFVDNEVPSGAANGVNITYQLATAPNPVNSLLLFRNGVLQRAGTDYSLNGATITFLSGAAPQSGDSLSASYRLGGTAGVQQPGSGGVTFPGGPYETAGAAAAAQAASAQKGANLSDLTNVSSARTNLGLGSAATRAVTDFEPVGASGAVQATSVQKNANLSDLASASTARSNLGLGSAATRSVEEFESPLSFGAPLLRSGNTVTLAGLPSYSCQSLTVAYSSLTAAGAGQNVAFFTMPEGALLTHILIKEQTQFTFRNAVSPAVTALTVSMGRTGAETEYAKAFALMQLVADGNLLADRGGVSAQYTSHPVVLRFAVTNANPGNLGNGTSSNFTAGSLLAKACYLVP